jgi:hypothetical protein
MPSWKVSQCSGGEAGIRTLGGRKASTVFETAAFDHSATSPVNTSLSSRDRTYPYQRQSRASPAAISQITESHLSDKGTVRTSWDVLALAFPTINAIKTGCPQNTFHYTARLPNVYDLVKFCREPGTC